MKRILSLLLIAMLCAGLMACAQHSLKQDTEPAESVAEPAEMPGLTLTAAKDVMVILYSGFVNDDAVVSPAQITEKGDLRHYYYPEALGSYHYTASGNEYYSITKNIYIPENSCTVLDVTPDKRVDTGWEPTEVLMFADGYIGNFPSDPAVWPDYQEAFQTPEFTTQSAPHQHTTQQEMEAFIAQLDQQTAYMYTYSLGVTGYGNNIPLAIFTKTDLSKADSLEEAAQLLQENGKLTIQYQGQMHGNEPAGGEAVLAMMLKLSGRYGEDVLDTVNIYCIPRVNPDGAQDNSRRPPSGKDINADYLLAKNMETQVVLTVAKLFKPTVMLDSHEYTAELDRDEESWKDLLISPGFSPTSGEEFKNLGITMTQNAFDAVAAQGMTYNYYTGLVNSKSAYVGRNYAALSGTLFFLIESRGIYFGNQQYARRTVGHLITATSFIDYIVQNADTVKAVVDGEKQQIIQSGLTYEESDLLVLQSSAVRHPELDIPITRYNTATGEGWPSTIEISVIEQIDRSRSAPTAYVIPAGESWTSNVLALMDLHGIRYTFAPAGSSIFLQGYTGTTQDAVLTQEQCIYFENGAYVFTMAQEKAKILAMLLEPDVTDIANSKSTLAMACIIPQYEDTFPIYRYVRNLNSDGTITVYK